MIKIFNYIIRTNKYRGTTFIHIYRNYKHLRTLEIGKCDNTSVFLYDNRLKVFKFFKYRIGISKNCRG